MVLTELVLYFLGVHNDYGDGERSQQFFKNNIPLEQGKIAARVRKLVHSK